MGIDQPNDVGLGQDFSADVPGNVFAEAGQIIRMSPGTAPHAIWLPLSPPDGTTVTLQAKGSTAFDVTLFTQGGDTLQNPFDGTPLTSLTFAMGYQSTVWMYDFENAEWFPMASHAANVGNSQTTPSDIVLTDAPTTIVGITSTVDGVVMVSFGAQVSFLFPGGQPEFGYSMELQVVGVPTGAPMGYIVPADQNATNWTSFSFPVFVNRGEEIRVVGQNIRQGTVSVLAGAAITLFR